MKYTVTTNGNTKQVNSWKTVSRMIDANPRVTVVQHVNTSVKLITEFENGVASTQRKVAMIWDMEYNVTPEFNRRIREAIAETQRFIDKEMKYREEFRKMDRIAQWKKHIAKLEDYLA